MLLRAPKTTWQAVSSRPGAAPSDAFRSVGSIDRATHGRCAGGQPSAQPDPTCTSTSPTMERRKCRGDPARLATIGRFLRARLCAAFGVRAATGLRCPGRRAGRLHTDSWWIPVELGFMLWAVCPASRAGCRGQLANCPNRDHPDLVRGRCRGRSSWSVDRADLGWVHPAADGLGRRVAMGLGRQFLQRAAVRPAGRRLARRARAERSHGAGFGEPLPARCRQHVPPIYSCAPDASCHGRGKGPCRFKVGS